MAGGRGGDRCDAGRRPGGGGGAKEVVGVGVFADALADVEWRCLVLDEAQAIKNPANETAQQLRRLSARTRLTLTGTPVSTTHTITGSIVGVGATRRLSAVKWGVAGRIVWAWILTIPASAVMAGLRVVAVRCDEGGNVDLADLQAKCEQHAERLACVMITYPSTYGVFEARVKELCALGHRHATHLAGQRDRLIKRRADDRPQQPPLALVAVSPGGQAEL